MTARNYLGEVDPLHRSGRSGRAQEDLRAHGTGPRPDGPLEVRWDEEGRVPAAGPGQSPVLDFAVAGVTVAGSPDPVDRFTVLRDHGRVLLALAHGMGAGAGEAAGICDATVREHAASGVVGILEQADDRLREASVQAVMTVAAVDPDAEEMTWAGVGSVSGTLLRGSPTAWPRQDAALVLGGVLGERLPSPQASVRRLGHGDVVLLTTRGFGPCDPDRMPAAGSTSELARQIRDTAWNGRHDAVLLLGRYLSTRFS
jgi:hypothetical protein